MFWWFIINIQQPNTWNNKNFIKNFSINKALPIEAPIKNSMSPISMSLSLNLLVTTLPLLLLSIYCHLCINFLPIFSLKRFKKNKMNRVSITILSNLVSILTFSWWGKTWVVFQKYKRLEEQLVVDKLLTWNHSY